MIKKSILITFFVCNVAFGAVWSKTEMQIATGKIIPFLNQKMSEVIQKTNKIEIYYKNSISKKQKIKNDDTLKMKKLDKLILIELQKENFLLKNKTEIR